MVALVKPPHLPETRPQLNDTRVIADNARHWLGESGRG